MHEDCTHFHHENNTKYKGLTVQKGIENVHTVNPYKKKQEKRKKEYTASEYVDEILLGNISVLSQAITLIESTHSKHQTIAQKIIEQCLPHTGKSIRVGITGVPGAGKSTFIESLGSELVEKGHKLAVLAIDPSSQRTKGSILGDKTRMEKLSTSSKAFIRPSPSAGSLGGVARKTRESIVLCEAAGFDVIFIETVGVGQSEVLVHSMVDFFLLIQLAGTGDELQGIKRGIMEMADGIAINKCDGTNIDAVRVAKVQYQSALKLFPKNASDWTPEVVTCSSIESKGIVDVWRMIEQYVAWVKKNSYFEHKRATQSSYWMYETIHEKLKTAFYSTTGMQQLLTEYEKKVSSNQMSSFIAAKELLDSYFRKTI